MAINYVGFVSLVALGKVLVEDVQPDTLADISRVLVSRKAIGDTQETRIVDRKDFVYIRNRVYDYVDEDIVIVKNRFCESGLYCGHLASLLAITR